MLVFPSVETSHMGSVLKVDTKRPRACKTAGEDLLQHQEKKQVEIQAQTLQPPGQGRFLRFRTHSKSESGAHPDFHFVRQYEPGICLQEQAIQISPHRKTLSNARAGASTLENT